ncbi:MAG TPA: hypothetical protein VJP85_06485 [Candidatus Baltobacteraceae bacterium]|nr:hypothetical protein [Candidatus Baltobacteraceae bacterium]
MGAGQAFDWSGARAAFFAGEYSRCCALLAGAPEPQAQIWHARIDSRQVRYADAIARLLAFTTPDPEVAAERDTWLAAAYANSGEIAMAHQLLDRAFDVLRAPHENYYRALHVLSISQYLGGEYAAQERTIERSLESPYPVDRAQAYSHRSWIAARREDFRAQIRDLLSALQEHEESGYLDQYAFTIVLLALAALCREIPTTGIVERVRGAARHVRSTEGTVSSRFQLLRVLGWIDALQGNEISALSRFREAEAAVPSEFWNVFCLVDRAYLARAMQRRHAARDALRRAEIDASRLPWENTRDEERLVLLTIAQLFAPENPALAERYLAAFRSLKTGMHARMGWIGDRRTRALQLYPHGIALLHLGERSAALDMLKEAWRIFTDVEYGWRAALCAFDLYEATAEPQWLERAREQIAPWPQSWVAREVRNSG